MHAQQRATNAAWHADVAARSAHELMQWVYFLWGQVFTLQNKIKELEEWKKKALDDMSRLKSECKLLRQKVLPGEETEPPLSVPKTRSLPLLLADHVDAELSPLKVPLSGTSGSGSTSPRLDGGSPGGEPSLPLPPALPPGLELPGGVGLEEDKAGKQVRFSVKPHRGVASLEAPAMPTSQVSGPSSPSDDGGGRIEQPPRILSTSSTLSTSSHSDHFNVPHDTSSSSFTMDDGLLEGVTVERRPLDGSESGSECERAEWRIGNLSTKLKGCMGRALVSRPFSAWGLEDLRLMVFPDGKDVVKGPRSKRQKDQYAKKVTEGPLDGSLKLKVPDCPAPHVLTYYLKVGGVRKGPFVHNFAESTVNGCSDFGVDWLKQVDGDQRLTVSVEILQVECVAAATGTMAPGITPQ